MTELMMKRFFQSAYALLKQAIKGMRDDQAPMMGAALAYYTMFSVAPFLIIAIGIAGLVLGHSAGADVFNSIRGMVGPQGAEAIQSMVQAAARRPHAGALAAIAGFVTLFVGASGVFQQLQHSLNIIWKVATHPKASWWVIIRQRTLSFGMVAVIGFLLLVSMCISAALAGVGQWASGVLPGGKLLWNAADFLFSLTVISALFCAVLKFLPDVRLSWRQVSIGGVFTAVLFEIGKAAIGAYLGRTGLSSSYGAAGSLIVILLWVYYSSQILFFGAEFTRAYATRGGRAEEPKAGAILTLSPLNTATLAQRAADAQKRRGLPPKTRKYKASARA